MWYDFHEYMSMVVAYSWVSEGCFFRIISVNKNFLFATKLPCTKVMRIGDIRTCTCTLR